VAERIVEVLGPTRRDLVVEIGPGQGALTHRLARAAGRFLAIEVDRALARDLMGRFADQSHVEIRVADGRSFDYRALPALRPDPGGRVLVAGNLPYSVGKPILMALVEAGPTVNEMALMLQKEVAERVAATPGSKTYGSLSVLTQLACQARLCFTVPPGAFRPPPQVESAVLYLRARAEPVLDLAVAPRFRAVVLAAFGQRRKSLANALSAGLGISAEVSRAACAAAGVDPGRRAETLSLDEFVRLTASVAR
jgi:16S rRNA (adenine1518-N6/adenine1519-N6)-dimethyltransferase